MNGNGGSSGGQLGSGSVANAATGGDQATGGSDATGCECPVAEPDVRVERECTTNGAIGAQMFGVLSLPGKTIADLARIRVLAESNETVTGMPEGHTTYVPGISYGDGVIAGSCVPDRNEKVIFFVPADLAP